MIITDRFEFSRNDQIWKAKIFNIFGQNHLAFLYLQEVKKQLFIYYLLFSFWLNLINSVETKTYWTQWFKLDDKEIRLNIIVYGSY